MMNDKLNMFGEYHIEGWENGVKTIDFKKKNVITQTLFNAFFDALDGTTTPIEIAEIATGTGTNTAMKSDTALQTEVFRKAISSKSRTSKQFIVKLSLGTAESAFVIREIGVFTSDGDMISRVNVNIDKNSSTQLLITYTLTAQ